MYPLLRGVPSLRCVEIACRGNEIRLARCVWVSVCVRGRGGRGEGDPIWQIDRENGVNDIPPPTQPPPHQRVHQHPSTYTHPRCSTP